jgi:hypothetical protein
MNYYPHEWLVIKITPNDTKQPVYKVFGTWYGSYLTGSSWRMNSGIVSVESNDDDYIFSGSSSSKYFCRKKNYGSTSYGHDVLSNFINGAKSIATIEIMDADTDWTAINYEV